MKLLQESMFRWLGKTLEECNIFKSVETWAFFFRLRDHVHGADNNPLLIFPEDTCVNNHYSVMFKKVIVIDNPFRIYSVYTL